LRELFKTIELKHLCQPFSYLAEAVPTPCWRAFLTAKIRLSRRAARPFVSSRSAKYQRATSTNARATSARERIAFRVMQWLVLCGIPTGVQGCVNAASTDPTNQLPTSHLGQATWPPGSSTAHLQLFESSTGFSPLQPATGSCRDRQLRLAENISGST
jgi:hypothetical protein